LSFAQTIEGCPYLSFEAPRKTSFESSPYRGSGVDGPTAVVRAIVTTSDKSSRPQTKGFRYEADNLKPQMDSAIT
jgi:hypothetical protein